MIEEVKICAVFENDGRYRKLFKKTKEYYFFLSLDKEDDDFYCTTWLKKDFEQRIRNGEYTRIDKVPSKTVEVEEEVFIYIDKKSYDELMERKSIYYRDDRIHISLREYNDIAGPRCILGFTKIKTTKTLDFNWDTGEWEEVK
jgi:hypothetical protein